MPLSKTQVCAEAAELRAIATMGRQYAVNDYDRDRYQRVLDVALRLAAGAQDREPEFLRNQHLQATWAQVSPQHGAEALVVRDNTVLLMKRHDDGLWALPGGLVEVGETLAESAIRELGEETGLDGKAVRLLGVFDSRLWGSLLESHLYHAVFLVEASGEPRVTSEATEVGFFSEDRLPPLSPGHDLRVPFLLRRLRNPDHQAYFDQPKESLEVKGSPPVSAIPMEERLS